ncbi:MAG: hypothetical protein MZU97_02820 [Bacillus subtilis]|nr:hypothetical protein [Bacillus subtilis]
MIGLNTAIFSPSKANIGIGFAIPASVVKKIVPDLIKYGHVKRDPILGIVAAIPVNHNLSVAQAKNGNTGLLMQRKSPEAPRLKADKIRQSVAHFRQI